MSMRNILESSMRPNVNTVTRSYSHYVSFMEPDVPGDNNVDFGDRRFRVTSAIQSECERLAREYSKRNFRIIQCQIVGDLDDAGVVLFITFQYEEIS